MSFKDLLGIGGYSNLLFEFFLDTGESQVV